MICWRHSIDKIFRRERWMLLLFGIPIFIWSEPT